MPSQRAQRVGETIQQEISALLLRGLKDPRIGFVTITGVEMTPDLHLARIYYTVMGDEAARKASAAGLKSSIPFIRQQLGRQLRMKYTPDLIFQYDSSIEYGSRIESLLRDVHVPESDD
ncbi:MAG: 30S ribosome-binding factor RbfA [Deltaproteobacteria bacterium]|nr:MAG: 30S ribosome-binding factor RbfA [Deltaproteobacteria bacterium]